MLPEEVIQTETRDMERRWLNMFLSLEGYTKGLEQMEGAKCSRPDSVPPPQRMSMY